MADKKAYMKPEEPFHLQMLRKEKEEKEEKELAEKGFWAVKKTKKDDAEGESGEDTAKETQSMNQKRHQKARTMNHSNLDQYPNEKNDMN